MRLSGVFWVVVALLAGATNFTVKHLVQSLDDELGSTRRKTIVEQKQIHDLTAEWTYLNQPELLSDLNRRYIGLAPVSPKQIQHTVDEIPLRPPPPPEAELPIALSDTAAAPDVTLPLAAAPAPVERASAVPPPRAIVAVAATTVTRAAPIPVAGPGAAAPRAPSLDALFAQVAGGR
jgi:hypothetical protein